MDDSRKSELEGLFNDTANISFGCVMFDLQEIDGKTIPYLGSGWASIEGKKAFRIQSVGDLSTGVKWITNLSHDVFWKSGAMKQTKLKYSGYMRVEIGQIMKELGMVPPTTTVVEICQTIAEIFSRVMRLAIEYFGLDSLNQKDLIEEIRSQYLGNDGEISTYVDRALLRSYQDLVLCEKGEINKSQLITLRRPRLFHAKKVLETMIPKWDVDWEFLGRNDLPDRAEDRVEFLKRLERPFLAKISIRAFKIQPEISFDLSRLLNLGEAIGEGGKREERNWICQPEFLYLHKFADLDVEAVFMAEKYEECGMLLPNLGKLSDFSYALGVFSENVWLALASRSHNLRTKSKTLVSPRACWLKSADRLHTLTSAMLLASSGFSVASYGYGAVSVLVEDDKILELIQLAPHAGLTVPISLINKLEKLKSMQNK